MARMAEFSRYELLRGLLETAIEDATWGMEDEVYHYLIFISEGMDEVLVYVNQSDAEQAALIEEYDGWYVETATNYEDAIEVAQNYFDLR